MRTIHPSPLLKWALGADAAVSGALGAIQCVAAGTLAGVLGLPGALLAGTGAFLLGYAALLVALARRERVWAWLVAFIVVGNVGWALGCAVLALDGGAAGGLGVAYLALQIVGVLAFAGAEGVGLRHSADADAPPAAHPTTRVRGAG
jgi:hypothetical protein